METLTFSLKQADEHGLATALLMSAALEGKIDAIASRLGLRQKLAELENKGVITRSKGVVAFDLDRMEKITRPLDPLEGFEMFWREYPRKQYRLKAEAAWKKLMPNRSIQSCILKAVRKSKGAEWSYYIEHVSHLYLIPIAATFLEDRVWESMPDEMAEAARTEDQIDKIMEAARRAGHLR